MTTRPQDAIVYAVVGTLWGAAIVATTAAAGVRSLLRKVCP